MQISQQICVGRPIVETITKSTIVHYILILKLQSGQKHQQKSNTTVSILHISMPVLHEYRLTVNKYCKHICIYNRCVSLSGIVRIIVWRLYDVTSLWRHDLLDSIGGVEDDVFLPVVGHDHQADGKSIREPGVHANCRMSGGVVRSRVGRVLQVILQKFRYGHLLRWILGSFVLLLA